MNEFGLASQFADDSESVVVDFFTFLRHLGWSTWVKAIRSAGRQRLMGLASEMAYNVMLALFPGILTLLTAIGLFDAPRTAVQRLEDQIELVAPLQVVSLIQDFVADITSRNQGLFSLSALGALWAMSSAIGAAMVAMDQIHQVPPKQRRPFIQHRVLALFVAVGSIAMMLAAIFLLFVSDIAVNLLASQSGGFEKFLLRLWQWLSLPIALGLVAIAFSVIYRFGPSRWKPGTPILPGAIIAAFCWALLSMIFRDYVLKIVDYSLTYGTLGTVIVLLIWLYLGCLVMLMGNQLNITVGSKIGLIQPPKAQRKGFRLGRSSRSNRGKNAYDESEEEEEPEY